MRYVAILAILLAACATDKNAKLPEGRAHTEQHPDFETLRPSIIAVLPVTAPRIEVRDPLRQEMVDRLFAKKYSCLAFPAVDKGIASDGSFDGADAAWDATFRVAITRWASVKSGRYFAVDGSATMTARTGEVLWKRTFNDEVVEITHKPGKSDFSKAIVKIGQLIDSTLPERPALKRE